MSSGLRVMVALAGSCAVAGGIVVLLPRVLPGEAPAPTQATTGIPPVPEIDPADTEAPEAHADEMPRFDAVRLSPDGAGLVAGQARPGASVTILADEEVAAEARADDSGRFVAFVDLPPETGGLELTLRDEAGTTSTETVVLAPLPEPPAPEAMAGSDLDGPVLEATPTARLGPPDRMVAVVDPAPSERPIDPQASDMASSVEASPAELPEAGGQVPVLLSDAEGVRVIQPALAPGADAEVLATVALDAIAYGQTGEVTLTGRGKAGDVVRLYLDNRQVAEARIGADGTWRAELGGTEPGTYVLRLDQLDAAGQVVSRIETPFQRERRESVAAAIAEERAAGQTIAVRTVQPGHTLWAIARDRYGEGLLYVRVFEANRDRIRNPDLIYPGQVFVLPTTERP
ncbi:Ig-like domain-containing protein [Rubellimicrobium roseum]|nr:Ig-like domain-containing protein [Rubellimicrobium roseum]